jgi:hypothetical protein
MVGDFYIKNADYYWRGKVWEQKTLFSSNLNTLDVYLHNINRQSKDYCGVIDISNKSKFYKYSLLDIENFMAKRKLKDLIIINGSKPIAYLKSIL